jgi:hypothetical protein
MATRHHRFLGDPQPAYHLRPVSLCRAHKERHAQFVSRTGYSGGIMPRKNHDVAIRNYPETA